MLPPPADIPEGSAFARQATTPAQAQAQAQYEGLGIFEEQSNAKQEVERGLRPAHSRRREHDDVQEDMLREEILLGDPFRGTMPPSRFDAVE
jgi:hypothetical protein